MLKVLLSCCRNPDIDMPGCQGYWTPGRRPKPRWVEVVSLAAASQVCREFIDAQELGSGNWDGGEVRHQGLVIARVSFNGRVWDAGSDFQIEVTGADLQNTNW